MFLTKMVNELLSTSNNPSPPQSNENQQNSFGSLAPNYRSDKKSCKNKKSNGKNAHNVEEADQLPHGLAKKEQINDHQKTSSKTVTHTKVKTCSWKRSEKSIAPLNAFNANKKHKALRKKSPNWLKFSNKSKRQDVNLSMNDTETTSACRPGILYSDVLFGAGCSKLVKIKNATPRNYSNASENVQKKSKSFFKYGGRRDNDASVSSEIDREKNLFPSLQKIKNKIFTSSSEKAKASAKNTPNNVIMHCSTSPPTKNDVYDEADVVILADLKALSLVENDISYGNYLEQHFHHINEKIETDPVPSLKENQFLFSFISNIPKWNFMNVEIGPSDGFPKFLCQFEDENYLKFEKMALLSLKLALGNSPQNK